MKTHLVLNSLYTESEVHYPKLKNKSLLNVFNAKDFLPHVSLLDLAASSPCYYLDSHKRIYLDDHFIKGQDSVYVVDNGPYYDIFLVYLEKHNLIGHYRISKYPEKIDQVAKNTAQKIKELVDGQQAIQDLAKPDDTKEGQ